jgi:hypothetical protein
MIWHTIKLGCVVATTTLVIGCSSTPDFRTAITERDAHGREWQVVTVKQVELTVQIQDHAGRGLKGYDFAVSVYSAGNITGYQRIWSEGRTFQLGARPGKVAFILWGQESNGAKIPIVHEIEWPDLAKSYRLIFRFGPEGVIVDPIHP